RPQLAELDVHRDRRRACRAEPVDQLRVQLAVERPAILEVAEGDVVDLHDGDVLRRSQAAAEREAHVDALLLEALEEAELERVRDEAEARHPERDAEEQPRAEPLPPLVHPGRIRRDLPSSSPWPTLGGA